MTADRLNMMKLPISIMSAAAAFLGYAAWEPFITWHTAVAAAGVFLLSAGAATLNNYQDRDIDRLMERTRARPIPSGRVSTIQALVQSAVLLSAGLAGLYFLTGSFTAPLTGVSALFLYNGFYTTIKKHSSFAVLPGVLCGMMPPVIGWISAGGPAADPMLIIIVIFYGAWQIPHMWLILLSNEDDYRRSGIPTMLDLLSASQLKRLTFIWTAGFSVMILFWSAVFFATNGLVVTVMAANAVILSAISGFLFTGSDTLRISRYMFHYLNLTTLGMTVAAVVTLSMGFN